MVLSQVKTAALKAVNLSWSFGDFEGSAFVGVVFNMHQYFVHGERRKSSSLLAHLPQLRFSVLDVGLLLHSSLTKGNYTFVKPYQQSWHTVTDSLIREMPTKPWDKL